MFSVIFPSDGASLKDSASPLMGRGIPENVTLLLSTKFVVVKIVVKHLTRTMSGAVFDVVHVLTSPTRQVETAFRTR